MTQRLDYLKDAQGAVQAMLGLERYLEGCGLEASLLDLVKLRVSIAGRTEPGTYRVPASRRTASAGT